MIICNGLTYHGCTSDQRVSFPQGWTTSLCKVHLHLGPITFLGSERFKVDWAPPGLSCHWLRELQLDSWLEHFIVIFALSIAYCSLLCTVPFGPPTFCLPSRQTLCMLWHPLTRKDQPPKFEMSNQIRQGIQLTIIETQLQGHVAGLSFRMKSRWSKWNFFYQATNHMKFVMGNRAMLSLVEVLRIWLA